MDGSRLIVVSGLPGVGKTTLADGLGSTLRAVRVSVDLVEDALLGAGLPADWTTGVAAYEAARAVAEENLALGQTVVVDAVNDSSPARETWQRAAEATGAQLITLLLVLADLDEHRERLDGRDRGLAHVPEPDWSEVEDRAQAFEPWESPHAVLDASAAPVDVLAAALAALDRD